MILAINEYIIINEYIQAMNSQWDAAAKRLACVV